MSDIYFKNYKKRDDTGEIPITQSEKDFQDRLNQQKYEEIIKNQERLETERFLRGRIAEKAQTKKAKTKRKRRKRKKAAVAAAEHCLLSSFYSLPLFPSAASVMFIQCAQKQIMFKAATQISPRIRIIITFFSSAAINRTERLKAPTQ